MRETLREFLRSGSSFKATADELHLHVNSALLLCHWFDSAVLN
jgi:sugar diacid utilization regulator